MTIARPVFYKGRLTFWAVTKGHQADLGGGGVAGYNPLAKSVWEEGLRLPPVKVYARRVQVPARDIWDLILLNVKSRNLLEGDLHCQVGATAAWIGCARPFALSTRLRDGRRCDRSYLEATEKNRAAAIKAIPEGHYAGEGVLGTTTALRWIGSLRFVSISK